jgi:uncharacterized protein (DUF924 family)
LGRQWTTRKTRFGRGPHRNGVLGRASTAEEMAHLAAGVPVRRRSFQS